MSLNSRVQAFTGMYSDIPFHDNVNILLNYLIFLQMWMDWQFQDFDCSFFDYYNDDNSRDFSYHFFSKFINHWCYTWIFGFSFYFIIWTLVILQKQQFFFPKQHQDRQYSPLQLQPDNPKFIHNTSWQTTIWIGPWRRQRRRRLSNCSTDAWPFSLIDFLYEWWVNLNKWREWLWWWMNDLCEWLNKCMLCMWRMIE